MNNTMNNNNITRTWLRSDTKRFAGIETACVSGLVVVKRGSKPILPDFEDDDFKDIETARVRGTVTVRRRMPF
jgi:hypothetical protein